MAFLSHDDQTIVAQCSPKGSGAIGLIRISGMNAFSIADSLAKLPQNKTISSVPTHTIHYGKVLDRQSQSIDAVLFLVMRGPHTFTGQDTVEITCHNNQFIIESIINQAIHNGARLAQSGEFTRRAVDNEKIDLVQAEAIKDLIHANSQEGIKRSLAQLDGTLSHHIHTIEKELIKALALCEASFEFLDEEYLEFAEQIKAIVTSIIDTTSELTDSFAQQKQIREGIRIALIGSVNAGKSSLFNALLQDDRAIVADVAGTTRDVIEAGMYRQGVYWTLIDTAGLRKTDDTIESAGIERSYIEAQKADIILLVVDQSRELTPQEKTIYSEIVKSHRQKVLTIQSKTDLAQIEAPLLQEHVPFSITDATGGQQVINAIQEKVDSLLESGCNHLLTQRQFSLLINLKSNLEGALPLFAQEVPYELLSHHIKEALSCLAEITGKSISERAMDAVFREFCVGK